MGLLQDLLGGGEDSTAAANKYLNQIPGVGQKHFGSYADQGKSASNRTNQEYNSLLDNPEAFVNKIMSSYKPSEGYKFQEAELSKALGNTAAAGGYAGGEYHQNQRGKLIQALLSGDMQQYLENVSGAHGRGLAGLEGIGERGYNASGNLADIEGGALNQQGGLAFGAAEAKNQRSADLRNALLKLAGTAAGAYFGGPIGAAAMGGGGTGGGGTGYGNAGGGGTSALFGSANALTGGRPGMPGFGF